MTEEFKKIIDEDIRRGKEILETKDIENYCDFQMQLITKYNSIIDSFGENLYNTYYDTDDRLDTRANIVALISKLELFKAMEYQNMREKVDNAGITINNSNHNANTNSLELNLSFEQAKAAVENMTALSSAEIDEILQKIDELEYIVQSGEKKSKKWENAKKFVKWVADKGFDVAKVILPLVLKIQ